MRLHKIVNDTKRHPWCGLAAVCMITGEPMSRVFRAVEFLGGPVKGTDQVNLVMALERFGYTFDELGELVPPVVCGRHGRQLRRPWLREWLASPTRKATTTYLVLVPRHWIVVRGQRGGDNSTGAPVPLSKLPCLDEPVEAAFRVERLARSGGGEDIKAARRRLGLSATDLAEVLRLGKGGGRTVRRWESGESAVPGPVQVAIELLLERRNRT